MDLATKQTIITGGATTITDIGLTASRALVSDANGKVAVSTATSKELSYLDGVTSAIQTQLNGKQTTMKFQNTHDEYTQSDSAYASWLTGGYRIMTAIDWLTNASAFYNAHKGKCIPIDICAWQTSDGSFMFPIALLQNSASIRGICPLNTPMTIQILWVYWD